MIIPHDQLRPETLTALIEEFVTRDGALHGHRDTSMEAMVTSVMTQLEKGRAVVVFDETSESASITVRDGLREHEPDAPAPTDEFDQTSDLDP